MYIHNGMLYCYKEEWNYGNFRKMDGNGKKLQRVNEPKQTKTNIICVLSSVDTTI